MFSLFFPKKMVRYLRRTENSVRNHIERTNESVVLTTDSKKNRKNTMEQLEHIYINLNFSIIKIPNNISEEDNNLFSL